MSEARPKQEHESLQNLTSSGGRELKEVLTPEDLAEVLGTAIGLNLLLNVPLLYGVVITGLDTLLFLVIQHFGIRKMEAFILMFVTTIGVCFLIEVLLAKPVWGDVAQGTVSPPRAFLFRTPLKIR